MLFLNILSPYTLYIHWTKDQRRTKDEPKMNLRTPNHTQMRFVKITISFISLISCLIPPRDHRGTTERTPHLKKSTFLMIAFLKRLTQLLKTFTTFLKKLTLCTSRSFLSALLHTFFVHYSRIPFGYILASNL